nr:bifunctional serine/threonine-protein kinase/ABC transporter substrate-binding protein [Streptomyces sp. Termitarium-T10T-6]
MDDLRPTDPARIGGHRLLGRLGAGGMGVVYLGRTDAGALAAIKVILPEHAGDEEFRTRFRREAEAARRVDSPWAVSVTGADTEAERPWLAAEFVPGPTLSDVVARRGPLPVRGVTVLGRLLARALASVHAAGLVHRDVKPGNVLLTASGPRLIDFGIARAADATALTATGIVVGTPGFLPPEQVSGGGAAEPAGSAGDVFSLGCLLAYAATGRPPFGSGALDAVLYRTVHDAPDLDGIEDPALRALLERCLAKDPGERPAAADLDPLIAEDVPAGATVDWLPEDVVRIIADRSAALLALPDIDATVAVPEEPGPPQPAPGRRRFLFLAAGGALALGGGALAAVRLTGDGTGGGGGDGAPGGRRLIIGVHADLTGPMSAAGRAQERGVRLAVDRFNSLDDQPFRLAVKVLDDQGDPARSARVAEEFARDPEVVAVIGPTSDGAAGAARVRVRRGRAAGPDGVGPPDGLPGAGQRLLLPGLPLLRRALLPRRPPPAAAPRRRAAGHPDRPVRWTVRLPGGLHRQPADAPAHHRNHPPPGGPRRDHRPRPGRHRPPVAPQRRPLLRR